MGIMKGITIKREVLLVEIDRRCSFAECNGRNFLGLTKPEVLNYEGFECIHCKQWNDDSLSERDIPEWWHEVNPGNTYS
jgi:hypothetical protein